MNIITYLKPVLFMKQLFGFVLLVVGIFIAMYSSLLFGLIFAALGLNMVSTEGSQINLSDKTYRKIISLFGIRIGKWKPCPDFDYVSVFKTRESQTVNVVTATATSSSTVILLNLFYGNKHLTFYKTTDKADAFKVAEHFRLALGVDILDATESEKKWL